MKREAKVLVAQLCPALCDPMDCSLPIYRIAWQSGWQFPSSGGFSEELNALSRREEEGVARQTAQGGNLTWVRQARVPQAEGRVGGCGGRGS